ALRRAPLLRARRLGARREEDPRHASGGLGHTGDGAARVLEHLRSEDRGTARQAEADRGLARLWLRREDGDRASRRGAGGAGRSEADAADRTLDYIVRTGNERNGD